MPSLLQPRLTRGRIVRLGTAAIANAPNDGGTNPHLIMSPKTPTGVVTTGIAIGLKAAGAEAVASGFLVTVWVLQPIYGYWFKCAPVALQYDEFADSFDINPAGLYFQVTAASVAVAGSIDFHCMEQ